MNGPLDGVRVVEVGVWHAGPGAGAILGDLGADVIKIESPSRDPERTGLGSTVLRTQDVDDDDWNVLFDLSNHSKKSLSIDVASKVGRDVVRRLVAVSDIFITNLRPPTKRKLGVDFETLAVVNPDLIHINVTGFGSMGEKADDGAFDTLGQAASGIMWVMADDSPVPLPSLTVDHLTATMAANAAITALLGRMRGGGGTDVHVSLYGAGTWLFYGWLASAGALGRNPDLRYNRKRRSPMLSVFECADGKWIVGTNPGTRPWPKFCEAIGRNDLIGGGLDLTDLDGLEKLYDELAPVFRTRTAAEWTNDVFVPRGIMFAPVQTFLDVLGDPQARVNDYVVPLNHPVLGDITMPSYPVRFGAYDVKRRENAAPRLGEHNEEILGLIGLTQADIEAPQSMPVPSLHGPVSDNAPE
ncbi:CaiB/BaiF CoA transferase family protein [Nocardioides sp. NPDC051685]|uniref:CaiB/BaiF CoA transferase family protein n=1 Tax=Nocardioides sp. NPDC051685 TaxID=3364334 RepID=UPI0037BADC0D